MSEGRNAGIEHELGQAVEVHRGRASPYPRGAWLPSRWTSKGSVEDAGELAEAMMELELEAAATASRRRGK